MFARLLLALDQFDAGRTALDFTTGLAVANGSEVTVVHVREMSFNPRVPPLESSVDAEFLVHEAVSTLRLAGVTAHGMAFSERSELVARRINEAAVETRSDAIVLGSRRLKGFDRLTRHGVREKLIRLSALPVLTAPAPITDQVPTGGHFWQRHRVDFARYAG
jgi:nucleotide-binding universal stress UspA family protein